MIRAVTCGLAPGQGPAATGLHAHGFASSQIMGSDRHHVHGNGTRKGVPGGCVKQVAACCCLAIAPAFGSAAQEPVAGIGNDDLLAYLGNMQIEARLDADVTGDGRLDIVYVASNVNERLLGVIVGGGHTAQIGRRAIAEGRLDPSPRVPVALAFDDDVLTVEDVVGEEATDRVTVSRYQYRYQPLPNRLRLVALSCEQYSPTLSHGSRRLSWNLEGGDHVVEHGQVVTLDTGEQVYIYESENRSSRKTAAIYMEDAPRPNDLLVPPVTPQQAVATDGTLPGAQSP